MPSVELGDIVHYRSYGTPGGEYAPTCRASVITELTHVSGMISLCVLNPTGQFFLPVVDYSADQPGRWHTKEECRI